MVNQELNLSGPCVLRILDQLLKYNIGTGYLVFIERHSNIIANNGLSFLQNRLWSVLLWALSWHCTFCLLLLFLLLFLFLKVSYPPDKGSQIHSCKKIGTKGKMCLVKKGISDTLKQCSDQEKVNAKEKFSLMFAIYSLIFFTCSLIFFLVLRSLSLGWTGPYTEFEMRSQCPQ